MRSKLLYCFGIFITLALMVLFGADTVWPMDALSAVHGADHADVGATPGGGLMLVENFGRVDPRQHFLLTGNQDVVGGDYAPISHTLFLRKNKVTDKLETGNRIAFASDRDGNYELYAMTAAGTAQTRLTTNTAGDWCPSWSPDASQIAFSSDRDGDYSEIYVMKADGTSQVRLTESYMSDYFPDWSPDGQQIAFESDRGEPGYLNFDIYVMNADHPAPPLNLTRHPAEDRWPSWSPDGSRIAFASDRDGDFEIYMMNANGEGLVRLTENTANDVWPAWSPDGRRIAFVSDRDGNTEIYVMNADGTGQVNLTRNPSEDGFPTWSPDGRRIAFDTNRTGNFEIYLANVDGTGLANLTNDPADDRMPAWAPRLTYTISGRVTDGSGNPISAVTISDGAGHTATTDGEGNYTLGGLAAGTYTITPSKSGWTFSPVSRTVSVPPDATGQDFTGTPLTYSISGQITDGSGNPIPGVIISDGAGHTATTDGEGNYTLGGLAAGTYTITPSKSGWTFSPVSRTVSVPPDATGKDFTGYDKPPIVFVHGWGGFPPWGSCEWPDPDESFQSVDDYLRAAGYYVAYARLETSPCYTPPLIENVPHLGNAIALAKAATNQPRVILIAHSMGGLVSRAYIEGPDYDEDVAALFTFGSPHLGVPADPLVFLFNGATLGQVCKDYQPVVCEFSTVGMILFNHDHPTRAAGVTYHVISGDAPFSPRSVLGKALYGLYGLLPRSDDGLVQTSSGTGLSGMLDRFVTDEAHGPGSGPRSYFIRDGGPSTSYMQCLKPVLVDRTSTNCGSVSPSQITVQAISALPEHTPLEHGTLLAGQTVTRTISLEGGPILFAAQWQTGSLTVTLVDPDGQVIDPAYAASHPEVVTYDAEATVATYYFPNTIAGRWQLVLEGGGDIPPEGSVYVTFAAFESALRLTGGTDRNWYAPGATTTITASLSGSPASAIVTATVLYADGTSETVSLLPQGGGEYQATFTVPNVPGYAEVRLVATGITAGQIPFERGTSLVFQISSGSVALSGVYSDVPQPRSAGSSSYQALLVTAGIEVTVGGEVGLSADLVDAEGQFVAHALTIEEVAAGNGSSTLRFDGDDIYASQRSGPYTLTNLLLTDHRGVPLVLAEAEDVYTTAAYDYRSFDREKIYLPLVLGNR